MTNEEAAAMLESMKNYFLPTSPMLEERREITALDLAISALSKQSASCEQADHIAEPDKMVKLKKRTITERLIIAESLINSVIADSDQFRNPTKKTEDAPDMNVGKIPYKKPEIIKYERHYDHTDCIWYRYLGEEEPNECPSTCSQYRDGWNDAMDYIFCNGKGYQPYERKAK